MGWKMAQILFDFADQVDYQKVRLDLANEGNHKHSTLQRLGFYQLRRNDSPCNIFYEEVVRALLQEVVVRTLQFSIE